MACQNYKTSERAYYSDLYANWCHDADYQHHDTSETNGADSFTSVRPLC